MSMLNFTTTVFGTEKLLCLIRKMLFAGLAIAPINSLSLIIIQEMIRWSIYSTDNCMYPAKIISQPSNNGWGEPRPELSKQL
jgi:hypothetical protein